MQKWKTSVSGFRSKCAMKRVQEKLKQKQIKKQDCRNRSNDHAYAGTNKLSWLESLTKCVEKLTVSLVQ